MIDIQNFESQQGFSRSLDSWQDETNADKFGNVDAIAMIYTKSGLENLTFFRGENLSGDEFNSTVFLSADTENSNLRGMETIDFPTSLDLIDMVKSTGKQK